MAAKAKNQAAAVRATGNTGARDSTYYLYDNDADNFDATLNSSSAEYFRNADDGGVTFGENRWATGGGIDVGKSDKPGGHVQDARSRDTDGTIDRVKDPPKELLPVLYAIRANCASYNIDLHEYFQDAGGSAYGTIATTKFCSSLVVGIHRLDLTEETLAAIVEAYGCGTPIDPRSAYHKISRFETVAWKDFCEDVGKAVDVSGKPHPNHPFPYGGPPQAKMR